MMTSAPDLPYRWLGGHPCLDFNNTVAWSALEGTHARPRTEYERLTSYSRLVDWARHAGLLGEVEADRLLEEAAERPEEAGNVLDRAIVLRQNLHDVFRAVAHRRPVDPAALAVLNAALRGALERLQLSETPDGLCWAWTDAASSLDRMLWPIAQAAADLLTSNEAGRVGECWGDPCGFLFLDTSHGGRRRWCDMAHCGNRAKARRHYRRAQENKGGRQPPASQGDGTTNG